MPVSYTHLDVYKRQVQGHSAGDEGTLREGIKLINVGSLTSNKTLDLRIFLCMMTTYSFGERYFNTQGTHGHNEFQTPSKINPHVIDPQEQDASLLAGLKEDRSIKWIGLNGPNHCRVQQKAGILNVATLRLMPVSIV